MKPVDLLKKFADLIENYQDKETVKKLVIELVTHELNFQIAGVFSIEGHTVTKAITSSSSQILSLVYKVLGTTFADLKFDLNEPENIFAKAANARTYQLTRGVKDFIPGLNYNLNNVEGILTTVMRIYGVSELGVFPCYYKGELKSFFVTGHKTGFNQEELDIIGVVANQLAAYLSFADLTSSLQKQTSDLTLRNQQLSVVTGLTSEIVSILEEPKLLEKVANMVPTDMNCEVIVIGLKDPDQNALFIKGISQNTLTQKAIAALNTDIMQLSIPLGDPSLQETNISVKAFHSGEIAYSNNLGAAFTPPLNAAAIALIQGVLGATGIIVAPIRTHYEIIGNIGFIFSHKPVAKVMEESRFFIETYTSVVGVALDNARSFKEKQQALGQLNEKVLALEEAYRKERDMMDILAHELRTPLSTVRNAFALLEQSLASTNKDLEKEQSYLKIIKTNLLREIKLLEVMLSSTKIDNNRLTLKLAVTDINPLVEQVFNNYNLHSEVANKQLDFKIHYHSEELLSNIDPDRVVEILDNIVSNAIKYTKQGSVHITTGTNGAENFVRVQDTGEGIPASEVQNLGKKFYRVNQYIEHEGEAVLEFTRPGGTGLGLYVAFNLARLLGGRIEVETQEKVGSSFTLILPKYTPTTG